MQGYMYSVFSSVAMVIHIIVNFNMLAGRGVTTLHGIRYRGFLWGVLAYYATDAAWGVVAGLGLNGVLYVETMLFFLSLVAFVFMWGRFAVTYLDLGKWLARFLMWSGYALLAFNVAAMAANPFCKCFFYFDAAGVYKTGFLRDPAFYLLAAFLVLTAAFVLTKAILSRDSVRRRSMMVFMVCITLAAAMILQVPWVLTPFTALGCLISICFFHVFVVQDEQAAKHAAELEQALRRAREAEKARSMFFSIVSHDIRTPLNAILGYSELLEDSLKSQAEKDEALKSIRASGTTLLQLVNDVLDLAKMDAGKMTLKLEPVQIGRLADEVFSTFRMAAEKKGLELVNRAAAVPTLMLDEHRFRQILFNLVGNAVKFTSKGGVTVSAAYDGSNLEVSVSDTGCGIARDMLMRVLDPFVQAIDPRHSADRADGTGLGLSICRRLVELMGGELVVESEPGKGSRFRVCIPGVESAAVKAKAPTESPKFAVPANCALPKHVLVVDDSPVNRAVLTAHLKKARIAAIDQASDGEEALEKLDSAIKEGVPFDFVFTDYWMPNMNGIELIEKIRADSRFSRLPVFAVTADAEFRRDPRNKLFTGVLLKPLTYVKIIEAFAG